MTIGALGAVAGPLIVTSIVTTTDSWRLHWWAMTSAILILSVLAVIFVRSRSEAVAEMDEGTVPVKDKSSDSVFKT